MTPVRASFIALLALLAAAPGALAQTGGQKYMLWCQGCHGAPAGNLNNVLSGKDWNFIKLAMDTRELMTEALRPAYDDGALTDEDFMQIGAYLQTFAPIGATVRPVVEYYNAGFGHYFTTADPDEIAGLDAGAFNYAFVRTGRGFNAFVSPGAGTVPVCRFFTTPGAFGSKSSHFYTANAAECAGLKLNPAWVYEKIAFHISIPASGSCAGGTGPVYRMYNNGQTGAPNHRFTNDLTTYQQFTSSGWAPENIGFCAPP